MRSHTKSGHYETQAPIEQGCYVIKKKKNPPHDAHKRHKICNLREKEPPAGFRSQEFPRMAGIEPPQKEWVKSWWMVKSEKCSPVESVEIFSSLPRAELSDSCLTSYREWPLCTGTEDSVQALRSRKNTTLDLDDRASLSTILTIVPSRICICLVGFLPTAVTLDSHGKYFCNLHIEKERDACT